MGDARADEGARDREEVRLVHRVEGDGEGAGREVAGGRLAGGVDQLRGLVTGRDVRPDDAVVVERFLLGIRGLTVWVNANGRGIAS